MKRMLYIIMCGGQYANWKEPRQLLKICGEPIVGRTIRLLRECGVEDIAISAEDERFRTFGVPVITHENHWYTDHHGGERGCWADAFFDTQRPACYLMGDVVFSPDAIKTIVNEKTDSIQFFASRPPFAWNYIKKYAEPFAFKVVDQKRFRAAIDFVRANTHTGIFSRHPIAWELWQVINGRDVREIDYNSYCVINGYTCDIDNEDDVRRINEVL